ncbi:MAG: hypothetical protein AB1706_17100 [Pseudomonadota bacterium]
MVNKFSGTGFTAEALTLEPLESGGVPITTPYNFDVQDNSIRSKINQIINEVAFETAWITVNYSDLSAGASKAIISALGAGVKVEIAEIIAVVTTSFSGGGGDRLLLITDGTTVWSLMPAATLQAAAAIYRWGDAGLPDPATVSNMCVASVANTAINAKYSGGSADYTAGQIKIKIRYKQVA